MSARRSSGPELFARSLLVALLWACGAPPAIEPAAPTPTAAPTATPTAAPAAPAPADATLARFRDQAARLEPLVESALGRRFLSAVPTLPSVGEREVFQSKDKERWLTSAAMKALPPTDREGWQSEKGASDLYYETHYGTPLAYARALDLLGKNGVERLENERVLDFGYGTVGHLRLLASMGAHAVGVDVDPFFAALYDEPSDQGPFPPDATSPGSVKLVLGRWPAQVQVVDAIGGGYRIILTKNVLKRGYFYPTEPVPPREKYDLGVPDEAFVTALHRALAPGGMVMIYNASPRPALPGEKYRPHADGHCPFPRTMLEKAGFEVVALDQDDSPAMRNHARVFGWDVEMKMDLETSLFAMYTLLRRPR